MNVGDRVEIAFNPPSIEELKVAKNRSSYQQKPQTGVIAGRHVDNDSRFQGNGPSYMVKVDVDGRDRLRVIPEFKLKVL